MAPQEPLLNISGLEAGFSTDEAYLKALRGVDLAIEPGEVLALVGESGCGKTLTALSILRLIDSPGGISAGEIIFEGRDLLRLSEDELNKIRGGRISMIFQEPMSALNPVFTIGYQICEVLTTHTGCSKSEARRKAIALLDDVGITDPEHRIDSYPFELSGGMRQRAMIAMALAVSPALLIADEPTTALDVTIQAQILLLIQELSRKKKMAVLLITHDLGIVYQLADRVAIMYAGQVVELGGAKEVLKSHKHPYTEGLLNSLPSFALQAAGKKKGQGSQEKARLKPIAGSVPSLRDIPAGCGFRDRCEYAQKECEVEISMKGKGNHIYRCIR